MVHRAATNQHQGDTDNAFGLAHITPLPPPPSTGVYQHRRSRFVLATVINIYTLLYYSRFYINIKLNLCYIFYNISK